MAPVRRSLAHNGLPAFSMMNSAKLPYHTELTCGHWTFQSPPALGGQVGKQQGLPSGLHSAAQSLAFGWEGATATITVAGPIKPRE